MLVALVSAMPGGDLLRIAPRGSAFSPATAEVAVQPLRAAARLMTPVARPDGEPAAGTDGGAILAFAPQLPGVSTPIRTSYPALLAVPPPTSHPALDGSPRGPPHA